MQHIFKALILGLFVFGLANCGSDKGGGAASAPVSEKKVTGNAETITLESAGATTVQWSSVYANIYKDLSTNGNCVTGLAQSADDNIVSERISTLQSLLNSSAIVAGTGTEDDPSGLPSVTIDNADGSAQTYYLVAKDEVSSDFNVLSKSTEILDLYSDLVDELADNGRRYCPGKGDDIPNN